MPNFIGTRRVFLTAGKANLGPGTWALPRMKAARARVAAGTGRGRIVCVGSSETAGDHAAATSLGAANDEVNAKSFSYPNVLASRLTADGVPASSASFMGDANYGSYSTPYSTYNPAVSVGGFSYNAAQAYKFGAGGHDFFSAAGNPAPSQLIWSPPGLIDTCEVYTVQNAGLSSWLYAFDGGAASAAISSVGAPAGLSKTTLTTALGSHTLSLRESGSGGNGFYLNGAIAYDSSAKAVDVVNAGWCGGTVANFNDTSNPWSSQFAVAALAADLYLIEVGVNDAIQGVPLQNYQASLQALVTALALAGDVILVTSPPFNSGGAFAGAALPSPAIRAQYDAVTKAVAAANGINLIDLMEHFGDWSSMNLAGQVFDNVHPNKQGYAEMGAFIEARVLALLG